MSGQSKNLRQEKPLGPGAYIALILIVLFFSGIMASFNNWLSFFDYATLSGKFGSIGDSGGVFTGSGSDGAKGGFLFAFSLAPGVMLAIGAVAVAEHYGAIKAAQKLLTPLLQPLLGIPGSAGLAMITSLQSTDAGATMTKLLKDQGQLTSKQATVFSAWQFSSGATITNFFGTGAALWALTNVDGSPAIRISMMIPFVLQLVMKFFGANIVRFVLGREDKSEGKAVEADAIEEEVQEDEVVDAPKKEGNPTTIFVAGAKNGLHIALNSIIPNVLMAYILILVLNITGLMDIIGSLLAPVMGIFGLPGAAATVLLASFMSMGGGVGATVALFESGVITGAHLAILSPAMFLMGALLQYAGRLLAVVEVEKQGLLFGVSILNALLAMFIMNIFV